jgi:N-acetylglutamate synthase-like GNAT family acetyltransferase
MAVTSGDRFVKDPVTIMTTLRKATEADLKDINELIDAAVMTWDLPERVKRLSLSSYHYKPHDMEILHIIVAEDHEHQLVGVAAWESVDPADAIKGFRSLLLHGIYVKPNQQHKGIGTKLFQAAEQAVTDRDYSGLMVKAQANAIGFFLAQGMQLLKVKNQKRDYAHRYWKLIEKR